MLKKSVDEAEDHHHLIRRSLVLGQSPGGMSDTRGAEFCQPDLPVPTRAYEVRVTGEGQEFRLENVGVVPGGKRELLPTVLPIPDYYVEIVGAGGQEIA